jgi:hypothetical protein
MRLSSRKPALEGIFQAGDGTSLSINLAMARVLGFDSPEEVIAESRIHADNSAPDQTAWNAYIIAGHASDLTNIWNSAIAIWN